MTTDQDIETVIPDLSAIPVDKIPSGALASAIKTYRERMKSEGVPLSSFQARI